MPEATPSTLLTAYRALSSCLAPLAPALLRARAARGKEEPARMAERLGRPVRPRPAGRLVWIHGASVGEALAVQPLIAALVRHWPDLAVLLTTQTVTGARVMEGRLRAPAFHQYAPIDTPGAVSGFLDHWRPDLAIWLESELWPNALEALRKRSVPALLVNARLSGRSREGWARRPRAARALLSTFAAMLAVDAATAQTLTRLAGRPARHLGNLKLAANPLQADETALVELRAALAGRPVWLAASTHEGEEALVARVGRRLAATRPGLLTIILPRHPERGGALAETLRGTGFELARRSAGEPLRPSTEIYLADTLGEVGLFIRLAAAVMMGGSFVPVGGHNPLEPALLGRPVLYGPLMESFAEICARLEADGLAEMVADEAALAAALARHLETPAPAAGVEPSAAARRLAAEGQAVLAGVLAEVDHHLPTEQRGGRGAG